MRTGVLSAAVASAVPSFPVPAAGAGIGGFTLSSGGNISSDSNQGLWCCRIRGTAASLAITASGANVNVSVDGAAPSSVAVSGGNVQLFTGLSDAWHSVWVGPVSAGQTITLSASVAASLSITGSAPQYLQVSGYYSLGGTGGTFATATTGRSGTPNVLTLGYDQNAAGSNVPSIRTRINTPTNGGGFVVTSSRYFYVAVDGVTTFYDMGLVPNLAAVWIPMTAGFHDVNVWTNFPSASSPLAFGAVGSIVSSSTLRRMIQFGDSITEGNTQVVPSTSTLNWGCIDLFQAAASLGYCGGTAGVSGNTCVTLNNRLSAALAGYNGITSADVAVIHIGVNDQAAGWSSTQQTALTSTVNALLTKGFGKVLCRSPMPLINNNGNYDGIRAGIAATVTAINNANVRLVTTTTWPATADLHPTPAEYTAIAPFAASAYAALL